MDESTNNMVMPVAPMYGGGYGNNGGFGFGGDWAWVILLLVLFGSNGWGNGFGGGFGNDLYPWMNQSNQISGGFRDQMLGSQVSGIQSAITSGFGDVQTALCGGFAGVNASINGAQNAIAQQLFGNQIADMQTAFGLQSQLAQCCCDQKAATADLKYTIATEACNDRAAVSQGIQTVLDKLCQLELDAKNDKIADLERQLTAANLAASQNAQTASLRAGQIDAVDSLYARLSACPVPTMPVYGSQPIFSCNNNGCGCGCNGSF